MNDNISIMSVFDNEGYTVDRYSVSVMTEAGDAFLIATNGNPWHPLGVWSIEENTYIIPDEVDAEDVYFGKEIDWYDLPEDLRKFIEDYFEQ